MSRTADFRISTLPPNASQSSRLEIKVHDSLESLQALRPDWDALLDEIPRAGTFSTFAWLAPWWRAFGGSDRLFFLELRDPSCGSLVAIAPLALTVQRVAGQSLRVLRLMGDGTGDSDSLDLPVRAGYEVPATRALFDWLQDRDREWDFCRLSTVPSDSPLAGQLLETVRSTGWTWFRVEHPNSVIELPETWEAYLRMLSSKERGKVGLRKRRLEKHYQVRIGRCASVDQLDRCLGALFDLHGKHWRARGLPGSFESAARRQFYREIGETLLERDRLQFWLLEFDGRIVATQFGFRHGATVFSLQEGFDPDYTSDSPGYVLRSEAIRQMIGEGVRRYDFLGGSDESKLRWGAQEKTYLNVEFARPYTRGSACLVLTHRAVEAKRWLRSHLSARAWQAVKTAAGKSKED